MSEPGRFSDTPDLDRSGKTSRLASSLGMHARKCILFVVIGFLSAAVSSGPVAAQDDFDGVYDRACLNFRQGKYEEALGFYRKANRMKQDSNPDCLWGMAQTYSKLGAHKNVLQTCDSLILASGDDLYFLVKAWNLKGNELSVSAMENTGKPDVKKLQEALTAYSEVFRLSGLNVSHYNMGVTLVRLNRIDEGVAELETYVRHAEDGDVKELAQKIIRDPRRAVEKFAPDFSVVTSDGEYISLDDLKGKVILLDFWGTWCKPCISAVPFLSGLAKKYRDDPFVLLSVNVNDQEGTWRQFIAENKMNWSHTRDGSSKTQRLFQVNAFPTYILVDHEGIIRYRGIGSGTKTEGEVSSGVKKALKNLASSPVRPEGGSGNSAAAGVPGPAPDPEPVIPKAEPAPPDSIGKQVFRFRIPKPSINVTREELQNPTSMPSGLQNPPNFYRLNVLNWASLPDELFEQSGNLTPCSAGSMGIITNSQVSNRLEIIINREDGRIVRSFCNLPEPQFLSRLGFTVPSQLKPDSIYITLKDRLTGNSVQSDPVPLP